jgi:DNA-binding beta-propeller fold protein YncE
MSLKRIAVLVLLAAAIAGCGNDNGTGPVIVGPNGRLYVLNQGDATMYIYDSSTLQKVAEVGTRVKSPHYIEFSPDGQNFYIETLEQPTGHIAKFNANTLEFIDSVSVPVISSAIAITKDSRYGYVCDFQQSAGTASKVRKYDLATLQQVDSMQAGEITHDVKITSDGAVVVATNRATDNVTMIYTDEDTVTFVPMTDNDDLSSIDYGPMGVVIDHKDSLAFVACINSDEIRVLDIAAREIVDSISIPVRATTEPAGPTLLAVSPDNDVVFVTTQFGNSVVAVRVSTKEVLADIPLSAIGPFGISMSDDGSRVYAACVSPGKAHAYTYVIDGNTYAKLDSLAVGQLNYGLIWRPE